MSWSFDNTQDGPFSNADSDVKFHQYGLTSIGEVINVDSYCVRMAQQECTYVYLFQDFDDK